MRFISDRKIAELEGDKKANLQVIAIGLPRCATSSLQAAFESEWIGYKPCMHMAEVMPNSHRRQLVLDALNELDAAKRHKLLAELMHGYASSSDFPGAAFATDLMDMYPDAKFILNLRNNGTEWEKSYMEAIGPAERPSYYYTTMLFSLNRDHYHIAQTAWKFWCRMINVTDPRDNINRFGMPQFYDKYQQFVRDEAKKRGIELLEWRAQDGWKPLCELLDKPTPPSNVPFPRVNDKRQMKILGIIFMTRGLLSWIALGAAAYYGSFYARDLFAKALALLEL
ncbi:hypothetical protein BX600DRAFT_440923 [Xylariales sp. PMI_506]|nr:hypothetical protein BX600DRAFT_440923 [Xylariales sp. PMI_506]